MILSMDIQKIAVIIEEEIGTEIENEADAEAGVGQEMMIENDIDGVDLETVSIRETEMRTRERVVDENHLYIGMFLHPGMST